MNPKESIIALKNKLKNPDVFGFVDDFESSLTDIARSNDPKIIGFLLTLFDDDFEYDEIMFSIIHVIEAFDDNIYSKEIITNLEVFCLNTPRWASIVHIRIINSEPTLQSYFYNLPNASNEAKMVLKELLTKIAQRGSELATKVDPILRVL